MPIKITEKSTQTEKKVVGTLLPQEMYLKLKAESESDFMSISDLLRKIIYSYYKNKEQKGN